jgi:hypothetical protein
MGYMPIRWTLIRCIPVRCKPVISAFKQQWPLTTSAILKVFVFLQIFRSCLNRQFSFVTLLGSGDMLVWDSTRLTGLGSFSQTFLPEASAKDLGQLGPQARKRQAEVMTFKS